MGDAEVVATGHYPLVTGLHMRIIIMIRISKLGICNTYKRTLYRIVYMIIKCIPTYSSCTFQQYSRLIVRKIITLNSYIFLINSTQYIYTHLIPIRPTVFYIAITDIQRFLSNIF